MANNITRWTGESAPNTLLAIDPGASFQRIKVPYVGAALFKWGSLIAAALIKCPTVVPPFARPNTLVRKVCEELRIQRHAPFKTDGAGAAAIHGIKRKNQPHLREKNVIEAGDASELLTMLAVENPQIYRRGEARPEDIMALKGIYGAFMGGIDADFYSGPTPGEWKGSIEDKDIVNERCLRVLNGAERLILVQAQRAGDAGLSDHVLDAVGVGLFTLGRIGTGGVV